MENWRTKLDNNTACNCNSNNGVLRSGALTHDVVDYLREERLKTRDDHLDAVLRDAISVINMLRYRLDKTNNA